MKLSKEERTSLENIMDDLKILFEKKEIKLEDIDDISKNLKSKEAISYIKKLRDGSKPETALREEFFAGKRAILGKFLFKEKIPEKSKMEGFIDYEIVIENSSILLELKPLFTRDGTRLKQKDLDWNDHEEQLRRYLKEKEYLILTNLKKWYFFSNRELSPMLEREFNEFFKDFNRTRNLLGYLERVEDQSIRGPLDDVFFENLDQWVDWLKKTEFEVSEEERLELIIKLINKFIFIRTLEDYSVIKLHEILRTWEQKENRWLPKGKLKVLEEFFNEINGFFYDYYDTDLFQEKILEKISKDEKNIAKFYEWFKKVLGLEQWQEGVNGGSRGILQYNYRRIDEDILGKAYERFLAYERKEEGIYYTPKYVTNYIINNTVQVKFNKILDEIKKNLESQNFEEAKNHIEEFISIKVLDPACGSGSFLIKTLRVIWKEYQELNKILYRYASKYNNFKGTLSRSEKDIKNSQKISKLIDILGGNDKKKLISKLILRHIHGNDLDKGALEVAKLNIWLESIKLSPRDFRYENLKGTNHILPHLDINITNGDSLVGLPQDRTIQLLRENYKKELEQITKLRQEYLDDPTKEKVIEELDKIKQMVGKKLDKQFNQYLENNNLPQEIADETIPFHWALEFWYVYFDDNLKVEKNKKGFDIIVGNPPYVDYRSVKPIEIHQLFKKIYESSNVKEKYNLYIIFIEKGLRLLRTNGLFGYINPVQWMGSDYGYILRDFLLKSYKIKEIDDLSTIGVFEDPTLTNLGLFFFEKNKQNEKIKIGYLISKNDLVNNEIDFKLLDSDDLTIIDNIFMLNPDQNVRKIIKASLEESNRLKDFVNLEWGTSKSGYGKKKIEKKEYEELSSKEKEKYRPIVQTGDIRRHIIAWQGQYIPKEIFSDNRKLQFDKHKLVFSRRSSFMRVAYDPGIYYLGKVAFTSKLNKDINLINLNSVLNSKLINFFFLEMYRTLHPGGSLRFDIPYLDNLPIKVGGNKLKALGEEIINLKKLGYVFRNLWREYSPKIREKCYSFSEILLNDKKELQNGNFERLWISDSNIYPDDKVDLIEKEFDKFRVIGKNKKILEIFGIKNSKEELILQIQTRKREFRDIIYLEILELLDSRKKVKTLKNIFEKSKISVITPNIWKDSDNLIIGVENKFEDWLDKEGIEIKRSITEIDRKIQTIDNQIDAHIFRLYGLEKHEVETVLGSLNVSNIIKDNILSQFEKEYTK